MKSGVTSIHVWVPGIADTGGIQHYSWCMTKALRELFPNAQIRVFSRSDLSDFVSEIKNVEVRGFGHRKGRLGHVCFALVAGCALLRQRPSFCMTTHPAFAKVLQWMPMLGIHCLSAAHGVEVWGAPLRRLRSALSRLSGILSVSHFTQNVLIDQGRLNPARVAVLPDTFREDGFSPGPKPLSLLTRHGLRANQPVLLTVGRLAATEAYKGHDQVIAALPAIRASNPEVRYVIVGTGDDQPRLQACAVRHGQSDAVIFAGFIPEHELPEYYRLCDAFVMPSTGEGFGIVYLEALASGRPCIVGNQDASPEAIGNGRWGFAVDPRSPAAIAEAVIKLMTRAHDKPWLHEPATLRQEVIERYGFAAFKQSLVRALQQLVPTIHQESGI